MGDAEFHCGDLTEKDVIVYMDGNQIKFDNLFNILNFIKKNDKCFVTSCRLNGMGISGERGVIERFENFLLSQKYGLPHLPDAQCGCWGFRGDYLKEMLASLKSDTFEIELEVMNFFLERGKMPAYIGMDVGTPEDTTFNEKHSIPKLLKLSHWLQFNRKKLIELAEKFQKKYCTMLPPKYITYFQNQEIYDGDYPHKINHWEDWEGIKCICEKTCTEAQHEFHPCHEKFDYKSHKKEFE